MKITFKSQAEKFLTEGAARRRKPFRPATVRAYRTVLDTNLIPMIGKLDLQLIGSNTVRDVVTKLSEQGYMPRTIQTNVFLIKAIVKSATDFNGNQKYPVSWSSQTIDAPSIGNSNKAVVSAQTISDAISKATPDRKALYALLAGTGLRINEARAVKLDSDDGVSTIWLPQQSKVIVRQQMTRTGLGPVKTEAGVREVDICPKLNTYLISMLKDRFIQEPEDKDRIVFPDCENCYRDDLERHGIIGGFHTLRRFRITHLRMAGVPDPLVKFWVGHAAGNVTEQYTQVAGEIESRKIWAAKAGLGFNL